MKDVIITEIFPRDDYFEFSDFLVGKKFTPIWMKRWSRGERSVLDGKSISGLTYGQFRSAEPIELSGHIKRSEFVFYAIKTKKA